MIDEYSDLTVSGLRRELSILRAAVGSIQERIIKLDQGSVDVVTKRKILELDQRLGAVERGTTLRRILSSEPFSD